MAERSRKRSGCSVALVAAALAVEVLFGVALVASSVSLLEGQSFPGVAALILLGPAVAIAVTLFARSPVVRRRALVAATALVLVQAIFLVFGTGPVYPLVLGFLVGAWWIDRRSGMGAE
jgi:hypothetical protein